jgi:hypothetical protein
MVLQRPGATILHQRVSHVASTLSVLYLYDQNGLYLFDTGVRLDPTYKRRGEVRADSAASARIVHDSHGILKRELGAVFALARAAETCANQLHTSDVVLIEASHP